MQIDLVNQSEESIDLSAGVVVGTTVHFEGTVATVNFHTHNPPAEKVGRNGVIQNEETVSPQSVPNPSRVTEEASTEGRLWRHRWASRDAFLKHFHLDHLGHDMRNTLESLLCQYEGIFASHDFDLGQIQIATHTIKIQPDATSVYCRPFRCSIEEWRQRQHVTERNWRRPRRLPRE